MDKPSKEQIAGTFLRCFYATDDGFIDINWEAWTPLATMYTRLFWVWSPDMETVLYAHRPDQGRYLIIHTALMLLMDERLIRWHVNDNGKLVIKEDCVPEKTLIPNHKGDPVPFLTRSNIWHPERNYHDSYGSIEEELTQVYNIISRVIWHLA